jgi:hypothetical protein
MPVRREVDADGYTEAPERAVSEVQTGPWSPAQVVALAIGLFFAVLGGIALARTGLDLNDVHHPHRVVGWGDWHHTPLLALIELGFGVVMMLAGAIPGAWRGAMGLLSAVALGFGIFVVADAAPGRLHNWLGVHHANGWLYIVVGAVGLAATMLSPVIWSRRRTTRGARHRGLGRDQVVYER